jgi:hypothetical protein
VTPPYSIGRGYRLRTPPYSIGRGYRLVTPPVSIGSGYRLVGLNLLSSIARGKKANNYACIGRGYRLVTLITPP